MSKYRSNINLEDKNNILTKLIDRVKENSLVLDVGCSSGYVDEVLVKEKGCNVIGIEPDRGDAKIAEKFCKFVLRNDIEQSSWKKPLNKYKFDHIIFADVLEHLKDPKKVLQEVKPFLKEDGSILISIPNIAHVSIRLELLKGEFIPEDVGILDNTHLKYFTKKTMKNLVESAGYSVKAISSSVFDFPENQVRKFLSEVGLNADRKALEILSSGESIVFQYFFEIVKGPSGTILEVFEEKPMQIVKNFLKSVEDDHKEFKKNLETEIDKLRRENKKLADQMDLLKKSSKD